jgi:heme o synthase
VLLFATILLCAGTLVLLLNFRFPVVLLGLFNVVWYNSVYTSLKRLTAFAVVPGSVTGGIPPLIGWTAAGGSVLDPGILFISLFFIIGQIPHFWLLLLKYGHEYESAGLPSISHIFSALQIKRISYAWILAAVTSSVLLPLNGFIIHPVLLAFHISGILFLFAVMAHQVILPGKKDRITFITLNGFYLLVMILLAAEPLIFS